MLRGILKPKLTSTLIVLAFTILLFFRNSQDFSPEAKVPGDFKVYQRAVARIETGINPYVQTELSPYKYSPAALIPLKLLPHNDAYAWATFKFLCLASMGFSVLAGANLSRWKDIAYLLVGLALSWKGLLETLDYGQLEFLVFFSPTLAARIFEKQTALVGFLIGCLPWFKLPWGFLAIPFSILSFRFSKSKLNQFSIGFLLGFIGFGVIAPITVFGIDKTVALTGSWINLLVHQRHDLYLEDINQSVWSTATRWIGMSIPFGVGATVILMLVCLYAYYKLILSANRLNFVEFPLASVTPWLILMQLMNPLSWRWGSMLLIGAPFAAEKRLRSKSAGTLLLTLGVIFSLLLQLKPFVSASGFGHWTELHHYGSITIYWLLILLLCL